MNISVKVEPPVEVRSLNELQADEVITTTGLVKWFDEARGRGFIIPTNGSRDVLLHLSVLRRDGFKAPLEGASVTFDVMRREKGLQCMKVRDIDLSTAIQPVARAPHPQSSITSISDWVQVKVKWFNRARGFGFVCTSDRPEKDIFLHMGVVRKSNIDPAILAPGQVLYVRHGLGSKGLQATHVCLKPA
ncbi:MAG: cold shock protein (beta-ribbon, CspA family) [Parcubacteria group bacterium Gr01-1014_56]|nr:MAG: cold shock protein (beta-ribbon, CspA family) [Parcubacteria group bacterium Gr01-1014_56]